MDGDADTMEGGNGVEGDNGGERAPLLLASSPVMQLHTPDGDAKYVLIGFNLVLYYGSLITGEEQDSYFFAKSLPPSSPSPPLPPRLSPPPTPRPSPPRYRPDGIIAYDCVMRLPIFDRIR